MRFWKRKETKLSTPPPLSDVEALRAQARALEDKKKAHDMLQEMKERSAKSRHQRLANHFSEDIIAAMASRRAGNE